MNEIRLSPKPNIANIDFQYFIHALTNWLSVPGDRRTILHRNLFGVIARHLNMENKEHIYSTSEEQVIQQVIDVLFDLQVIKPFDGHYYNGIIITDDTIYELASIEYLNSISLKYVT